MERDKSIMRIFVTGAAGLLGSRFVEYLINRPDVEKIVSFDDMSGGYSANIPIHNTAIMQKYLISDSEIEKEQNHKHIFYFHDVGIDSMRWFFHYYKPTHIVHFAAYAAECLSPFIRRFNYTNNLIATANLINFSIEYGVKRFLFTSSMAVYGHQSPPFDESLIPCPSDPYGVAKYACEMDLKIAGEQHGLDWVVIRPHNVYGRNQNIWDSYRNVLGIWMWKHLNGYPLSIYGDGLQKRAFSCIDDSIEPMWRALVDSKASKQIINLGGIKEYTIREAADTLMGVMGGGTVEYLPPRNEVKNAWSTWKKSSDILGFEHKVDLYDGLKDMWNWAKIQPKRSRMIWSNYEIDKDIYPYWKQENLK